MKTTTKMRRGFTLVELLVVIAIIATLAGVGVPALMAKKKDGDRAEAIMNAKQIGLALFSFDEDYGSYPSQSTAQTITDDLAPSMTLVGPTTANDFMRQLIATNYMDQEKPFYARGAYTKKPDNNMVANEALSNGECGFAYIMGPAQEALSTSGNSGRPLLASSVKDAEASGDFDADVYNRKAVVLRVDNSASAETVRPSDSKVTVGGGKTLLDTGADTVWGVGFTPTLVPPTKK